ncbi:O-antigen ligase family protein [Halalkalicoccus salilacus]|uniref:O-antigen ligase family protein n=1 Tax=Halalkalicoccus salilacus TaxID=3117459 RepID=UPI00300EAF19
MNRLVDVLFALSLLMMTGVAATDRFSPLYLILGYLLLIVVAGNAYDLREHYNISWIFSIQTGFVFVLGIVLIGLAIGGLGNRAIELGITFILVVAFLLVRDDLLAFVRTAGPYLAAFAILFGIFLYHSRTFAANTGLGMFPVYVGFFLALHLFFFPEYVDDDIIFWSVAAIAGITSLLGILAIGQGEFTLWAFEVRLWNGTAPIPFGPEFPIVRSVFANPNTFGVVQFVGTVGASIAIVRAFGSRWPILAVVPLGLFALNAFGLLLSDSRASMAAAAITIGIYCMAVADRRLLPVAFVGAIVGVATVLIGMYLSILPIDPANRFILWQAGIEMLRAEGSLLGEGLIGTREAIEPYLDDGGGSVHNSYLSIFIRAGFLGGLAYLLLVFGPLFHGMVRYTRVNVPMFAMATGFTVHQLFEGYTLYQFGLGSTIGALAVGYVIASLVPDDLELTLRQMLDDTDLLHRVRWTDSSSDQR